MTFYEYFMCNLMCVFSSIHLHENHERLNMFMCGSYLKKRGLLQCKKSNICNIYDQNDQA